MQRQPGHRPRPAVHERDGDDRAHRGLALGQVGAPPATGARATAVATTLCDEPVSTTKLRRGPPAKRTATLSETSPGHAASPSAARWSRSPWVSAAGGGPSGPGVGRGTAQRCALGSRQHQRAGGEVDADARRSGPARRSPAGRPARPFPPIWGSVAAVSCWGARRDAVERPRADRDRPGRAGAPDAGELAGRAGRGQVEPPGQAGVDGRLPRPRVEDEGERALAADADVDRLGHLARPPCSRSAAPARPARAASSPRRTRHVGGRQGEGHLRLDVHRRAAGRPTDGGRPARARAPSPRWPRWRRSTSLGVRPRPSGRGRAGRWPSPCAPRARATASGRAARRQPFVVRNVKRRAERWWATIMR